MSVALPTSVEEVVDLLVKNPRATLLAGGTDLMVEVNLHSRRPVDVVALRNIAELHSWSIDRSGHSVTIGSGVPYAEMETGELARLLPALAEAARTVGSPQIRAAGTLGGNLGTCSPAGDGLPVLAALDATINVVGPNGSRQVRFSDFMVGVKRNSLQPSEFVRSVTIPLVDGWQGYAKVGTRNAMVIATASVCLVRTDEHVAVALGAVGPTIIRASEAEAWLVANHRMTSRPNAATLDEFGRLVREASRPIDDHRSTAAYRRHAVGVLSQRLLSRSYS
jgi:CO/xanthine dehydrogenase FAD-binding subunit